MSGLEASILHVYVSVFLVQEVLEVWQAVSFVTVEILENIVYGSFLKFVILSN